MPIPKPRSGEGRNDFITRCMGDETMNSEYPEQDQRAAVCNTQWGQNNMKRNYIKTNVIQTNYYDLRQEEHQGSKHIVVPVVMMVEGVHHGSVGPVFHGAEELGRYPETWNGIPVVVHHPEEGSANSPNVVDNKVVGRVYNTDFQNGKLKAECWLDENKLYSVSPEAYDYIRNRRALDVSVGVYTDDDPIQGDWNGEEYIAVSRNHRPDHLALLPGSQGACSWADGCGIRLNQGKGGDVVPDVNKLDLKDKETVKTLKTLALASAVSVNETGMREVIETIQQKLDAMDTDTRFHFLEEAFDDYFIYRVSLRREQQQEEQFYKRNYSVNQDGTIEFGEEPIPVTKKVEFIEIQNNKKQENNEGGISNMSDSTKKKIDLLIQCNHCTYAEEDRDWLQKLEGKQLDKMVESAKKSASYAEQLEAEKKKEPQVNKEQAIQALKGDLSDPEKFMQLVPESIAAQLNHGMEMYKRHRQQLISTITENCDVYSQEELEATGTPGLEKLARVVEKQKRPSYAGFSGGSVEPTGYEEEPLLPPGVQEKKE